MEEIAAFAAAAGLRYIIITDHETLAGLPEEGLRHGVIVLVGAELNKEPTTTWFWTWRLPEGNENKPQEMIDGFEMPAGLVLAALKRVRPILTKEEISMDPHATKRI